MGTGVVDVRGGFLKCTNQSMKEKFLHAFVCGKHEYTHYGL